MKIRILTLLTALSSLLAVPAAAQVNYVVAGGAAYVASSPSAFGSIVIRSTYNGYPVTTIRDSAFFGATGLTSVTIPDSVTDIGGGAFAYCSGLTSMTIPDSVTGIANGAFSGCTGLTSVTIPDSVTGIADWAFYDCTSLTRMTIPHSVANIGGSAFWGCTGLTNLAVDAANLAYSSVNGVLFNKAQTTLIIFPAGRSGSYVIPSSVTGIGDGAFTYCTGLTSVTIPSRIPDIRADTFFGCTGLTNLAVDADNLIYSSVNGVLFNKEQTALIIFPAGRSGSYVIPNSVTGIGDGAFGSCTGLTSVTIPDSVTGIAYEAFSGCTGLTNLAVAADNLAYSSVNGVLFNKAQTTLITCPAGRSGGYVVPNSVISIWDYAFYGCTGLTNLTFLGNAPALDGVPFGWGSLGPGATVYYSYGTAGWEPVFSGFPTVMLGAPAPQIGPASGVKPGGFGFTLGGVINQTIAVEASADLLNWQPIWTTTLSHSTSADFVDPQWLDHPHRFYRVSTP